MKILMFHQPSVLFATAKHFVSISFSFLFQEDVDISLQTIHNIATESLGSLCITKSFRPLQISLNTERYESARQKVDLAAVVLQDVGVNRHGELLSPLIITLWI